jgi:hypothetical protein
LILAIADNCHKLLGEKKYFTPQSKIRPGAAPKELQTRADFGISLDPAAAGWDLELFHPHSCQIVPDGGPY